MDDVSILDQPSSDSQPDHDDDLLFCPCSTCESELKSMIASKPAITPPPTVTLFRQRTPEQDVERLELEVRRRKAEYELKRLDRWDTTDDATESATGDDLDAFTRTLDITGLPDRLPALMERLDGQTLIYAGKLNSIFGEPGSGKSWVAAIACMEAIHKGGHVLYLDYEDTPSTLQRRSLLLGFNPSIYPDAFRYIVPGLTDSETAVDQAKAFLLDAPDPAYSLVVIDAAESAGCPSDGADVAPWYAKNTEPWRSIGPLS